MFGTVMKTYFAQTGRKSGADFHSLDHAVSGKKKGEQEMELFHGEYAGKDIDVVLTTREFVK